MSRKRALLRWFGGKHRLAPWIVDRLPGHQVYVEPYCGAASVLLRKPPAHIEVLGDIELEIEDVIHAVRDPQIVVRLIELMRTTPFSPDTLARALKVPLSKDTAELALRALVLSSMARSPERRSHTPATFRYGGGVGAITGRQRDPAADWQSYPDAIMRFHKRLRDVRFRRGDAIETMTAYDSLGTLHYIDPPYVSDTRSTPRRGYRHEMTLEDHERLLECATGLAGMAVISGYPSDLYDERLARWHRVEHRGARDSAANARTEVFWINPAALAGPLHVAAA
jgi:DNA adenine methylase